MNSCVFGSTYHPVSIYKHLLFDIIKFMESDPVKISVEITVPEIYIPNVDPSRLSCIINLGNYYNQVSFPIEDPICFEMDSL